jgi:hypothetical protein
MAGHLEDLGPEDVLPQVNTNAKQARSRFSAAHSGAHLVAAKKDNAR